MTDDLQGIFSQIESGNLAAVSSTLHQHPALLTVSGQYGGVYPGPPLHAAAHHGQEDIIHFLVGQQGASLQAQDEYGDTALHRAAWAGSTGAARALLDLGAPIEDQDRAGWTALHLASINGQTEVVELLLERGSRPSDQDMFGRTPLYLAAEENEVSCVEALLRAGAEDLANNRGETAEMFASKKGHQEIVELLTSGQGRTESQGGEDKEKKFHSLLGTLSDQNSWTGEVARQILAELKLDSLRSILEDSDVPSSVKDVALLTLFMTSQDSTLKQEIKKRVAMPVDSFTSHEDISLYIDALLTSGVDETNRAMLFIVGNTKVGKTSTMRTINRFCQGVPKEEMPFLTGDPKNHSFFETKVLDVINNVVMCESDEHNVALQDFKDIKMATFKVKERSMGTTREVVVTIYDAGGQREYFVAMALFMKDRVTFIVAFNGQDMRMTQVDGKIDAVKYQQTIGTYITLICQNCVNPCIQLLATKMDSVDGSEMELWNDISERVADHLNSFSEKTRQIVLASEILNISAKIISEDQMKVIVSRTAALLLSEDITKLPKSGTPKLWAATTSGYDSRPKVNVSELQGKLDELRKSPAASGDSKSVEALTKLQDICKIQPIIADIAVMSSDAEMNEEPDTVQFASAKIKQAEIKAAKGVPQSETYEMEVVQHQQEFVITDELALILRTFDSQGSIIWFHKNKTMKNFIIPDPMNLTKAIRCVINHDTEDLFEKNKMTFSDLVHWGGLSEAALTILYNRSQDRNLTRGFSKEDVLFFLHHLGLATRTHNTKKEAFSFVPSLISDKNKDFMTKCIKEMKEDPEALKMIYMLSKTSQNSQLFQTLIPKIASDRYNFKNFGIEFSKGFAQKIEERTIGEVGAMKGILKWTFGSEPEAFEFLLVDVETNPSNTFYASDKGLAVYVRACNRKASEVTIKGKGCCKKNQASTMTNMDKARVIMKSIFHKEVLESVSGDQLETGLICQDCTAQEDVGYFKLDPELCLKTQHEQCSNGEHQVSEELHALMSSSFEKDKKGFSFNLLEDGLDKIPTMRGMDLLEKIERNEVLPGSQIWIKRTKKDNALAGKMPYAHVLVYIGQKEGSSDHEVVHVHKSQANCLRVGPLMSTFQRINIHEVVKDMDEVFFGHEIPFFGISANIRETVKNRAIACSEEPELQFHYTKSDNCEGFANLIMGFNTSSNEQKAPWWMKLICCCVNPCYLCRRRTLTKVVMDRLREEGLWPEEGGNASCCSCC